MEITSDKKAFIKEIGMLAVAEMRRGGILASLTIAQAILESGWGTSGLTVRANALFGIKAGPSWQGKVYSASTRECYDGVNFTEITALFRAYSTWAESVHDHTALLTQNARYRVLTGERDYRKACYAIQDAGYATDPNYAGKLIRVIETYNLTSYDGITAPDGTLFCVGDEVEFTGGLHYTNSEAQSGMPCKSGTAEITGIAASRRHPIHLVAKTGGASTVHGWVDLANVHTHPVMRAGATVRYSGPVYRDSGGNGKGRIVEGIFAVRYYVAQRECGVHIDDLGWVPESVCEVIG